MKTTNKIILIVLTLMPIALIVVTFFGDFNRKTIVCKYIAEKESYRITYKNWLLPVDSIVIDKNSAVEDFHLFMNKHFPNCKKIDANQDGYIYKLFSDAEGNISNTGPKGIIKYLSNTSKSKHFSIVFNGVNYKVVFKAISPLFISIGIVYFIVIIFLCAYLYKNNKSYIRQILNETNEDKDASQDTGSDDDKQEDISEALILLAVNIEEVRTQQLTANDRNVIVGSIDQYHEKFTNISSLLKQLLNTIPQEIKTNCQFDVIELNKAINTAIDKIIPKLAESTLENRSEEFSSQLKELTDGITKIETHNKSISKTLENYEEIIANSKKNQSEQIEKNERLYNALEAKVNKMDMDENELMHDINKLIRMAKDIDLARKSDIEAMNEKASKIKTFENKFSYLTRYFPDTEFDQIPSELFSSVFWQWEKYRMDIRNNIMKSAEIIYDIDSDWARLTIEILNAFKYESIINEIFTEDYFTQKIFGSLIGETSIDDFLFNDFNLYSFQSILSIEHVLRRLVLEELCPTYSDDLNQLCRSFAWVVYFIRSAALEKGRVIHDIPKYYNEGYQSILTIDEYEGDVLARVGKDKLCEKVFSDGSQILWVTFFGFSDESGRVHKKTNILVY